MKLSETARLLGVCALYDARSVTEVDAAAWHEIVGVLDFEDAKQAVIDWHGGEHGFRIMPGDVVAGVKRIRGDRIGNRTIVAEVEDPDNALAYLAALRSEVKRVADGQESTSLPALTDEQAAANRARLSRLMPTVFQGVGK